uniref:Uncharacterized protein n=1 Tax=Glossina austeni TaxID=7395 RepID=A0A1A9UEG9_GLOAU
MVCAEYFHPILWNILPINGGTVYANESWNYVKVVIHTLQATDLEDSHSIYVLRETQKYFSNFNQFLEKILSKSGLHLKLAIMRSQKLLTFPNVCLLNSQSTLDVNIMM